MGNACDRWLGCCCFGNSSKEASLQFEPSSRRNCTDVLFFLLYVASWAGLIIVISVAGHKGGDPQRILHGVNWNGSTCGRSADVQQLPYAAWAAMPQSPAELDSCTSCSEILVCLASCNETLSSPLMLTHYASERLLYYCIPTLDNAQNISFPYSAQFDSASQLASRAFVDLLTVWPAILISAFAALVLSFVYAFLAKRFAGVLVFTSLLLALAGGALTSYALLKMASQAENTAASGRAEAMKALGIAVAVITGLFLLVLIALRHRIAIAVEVVKEASSALLDMWDLVLFPVLPFVLGLGYFVLFIATTLLIASVWTPTTTPLPAYIVDDGNNQLGSTYQQQSWDQSLRNSFAYVLLHLLWTLQFLVYFTFTIVAGAVASWYFTPRDAKGEKVRGEGEGQLSHFPVLGAFYRTVRFHLGTIALASLIIAIVEFIRLVVKYVEEMSTPKHGPPNRLQKAVFCLVQCCLACVQCCLDKISKNALVWCAIYGDNFAESACASFALVWANLARVAALSLVSAFILFVGKLLVAVLTTGLAAISILHYYGSEQLSSLVLPVVVIFLLSYLVAALFMATLDTTAATVFLCFLVDEKFNKQSGCMLASPGLQAVIDAHRETGAAYAAREQQKAAYRQTGQSDGAATPPQLSGGSQAVVPNHAHAPSAGNHPHSAMQLSTAPSNMV